MNRRVVSSLASLLVLCASGAFAQQTVFLVRHAERADATTSGPAMMSDDPELSAAGQARAVRLATVLKDAKVTAIYTTEYRRTKQTAAPLAKVLGIESIVVSSKEAASLASRIDATKGNVLVVGHSNTIPDIVKALGVGEPLVIQESDFDDLFVVSRGSLIRLNY